jgi:hypothetical protein
MGLSLPWHEPVLAKAVRTVYERNAVIFQYNRLEAERPLTQTSFSLSRIVCLVLSGGPTSVVVSPALPTAHERCSGVLRMDLSLVVLWLATRRCCWGTLHRATDGRRCGPPSRDAWHQELHAPVSAAPPACRASRGLHDATQSLSCGTRSVQAVRMLLPSRLRTPLEDPCLCSVVSDIC